MTCFVCEETWIHQLVHPGFLVAATRGTLPSHSLISELQASHPRNCLLLQIDASRCFHKSGSRICTVDLFRAAGRTLTVV